MANYSLILDTKFKPFSYQEMLAPVAAATQAHQALEDAYGELSAQAKTWGQYADEQTDYETYKMYKTYADDLEMQAEQLMRQGLTPSSRREMLNLRARYGEEIAPIEAAYKRREALAAEQRKLYAADKTLRFERDASTMKLSDFIKNPSLDYGESYSGALLTSQVSNAVAAYQRALTDPGKLKRLGLPFQYERYLQEGATPEQVLAAMKEDAQQGDSEAVNFLRGVVDQALASSGVADWADNNTLNEFRAFANQGLYNAIGTTKIQNYTDSYSMNNALAEAAETRAAARAKKEAEEKARQDNLKMWDIDPTSFYGESEIVEKHKKLKAQIEGYKKKGYLNSEGKLTKRGMKALQDAKVEDRVNPNAGPGVNPIYQEKVGDWGFKDWANSMGMTQSEINKGTINRNTNARMASKVQEITSNNATKGTLNVDVYRQTVTGDEAKIIADKITANSGDIIKIAGDLTEDGRGNITIGLKKTITNAEFKTLIKDNPILYIMNSPTTGSKGDQLAQLTNGEIIKLPKGVIGNIAQRDLDIANTRIRGAASNVETAVELNRANSYIGSILTSSKGSQITTNDGTIIL